VLGSVDGLELDRRDVAEVAMEALGVEPVHPPEGGEFDIVGLAAGDVESSNVVASSGSSMR
jgi:hypothetical protein